jgi:hypothetical protein
LSALTRRAPRRAQRREVGKPPVAMGEVLLSIELLPQKFALDRPAGHGRAAPNDNPQMAEPAGRPSVGLSLLSLLNPLFWLRLLVGFLLNPIVLLLLVSVASVVGVVLGGPYIQALLVTIEALTLTVDGHEVEIGWLLVQCVPTWMLLTAWQAVGHGDGAADDDDDDNDDAALALGVGGKGKKGGKPSKKAIADEPDDPDPLGFRVAWSLGPPLLALYQLALFFPKVASKPVRTLCRQGFVLAVWKNRYVTNRRRRHVPTSVGAVLRFFVPPYFAAFRILAAAPKVKYAKEVGERGELVTRYARSPSCVGECGHGGRGARRLARLWC